MDFSQSRNDIPIVLLYNIDPAWEDRDIKECTDVTYELANALIDTGHPVQCAGLQSAELEMLLENFNPDETIVFNWCEELPNVPRSEHQVAQILEHMGFTFTGAGSSTLALCQDKALVKSLLRERGIPTPKWQVCTSVSECSWTCFPAIVKLAFEHCSYGITRDSVVESREELEEQVLYVINVMHQPALVEEFIDGREFHVGVVGNGSLHVFPPAEIDYSHFTDIHDRICTYESNFDPTSLAYQLTQPKLPVILGREQLDRLEELTAAAYRSVGCRDYARMDIRSRKGEFYVLDVNPNPDISPNNSLVNGAEMMGLSYGKLGSLLINLAAQRHSKFAYQLQKNYTGENSWQEL